MEYKDLNQEQKAIVDSIEMLFKNSMMSKKDFITSILFLLNKYKDKK